MSNLRQAAQQALEAYDDCAPLAVPMRELRTALAEPDEPLVTWGGVMDVVIALLAAVGFVAIVVASARW